MIFATDWSEHPSTRACRFAKFSCSDGTFHCAVAAPLITIAFWNNPKNCNWEIRAKWVEWIGNQYYLSTSETPYAVKHSYRQHCSPWLSQNSDHHRNSRYSIESSVMPSLDLWVHYCRVHQLCQCLKIPASPSGNLSWQKQYFGPLVFVDRQNYDFGPTKSKNHPDEYRRELIFGPLNAVNGNKCSIVDNLQIHRWDRTSVVDTLGLRQLRQAFHSRPQSVVLPEFGFSLYQICKLKVEKRYLLWISINQLVAEHIECLETHRNVRPVVIAVHFREFYPNSFAQPDSRH